MNRIHFIPSNRAQGLPISTIIIIILVILVLVAVGIFFFTQFATGGQVAGETSTEVAKGGEELEGINWKSFGGQTGCVGKGAFTCAQFCQTTSTSFCGTAVYKSVTCADIGCTKQTVGSTDQCTGSVTIKCEDLDSKTYCDKVGAANCEWVD